MNDGTDLPSIHDMHNWLLFRTARIDGDYLLERLLQQGADANLRCIEGDGGNRLLHVAVRERAHKNITTILDAGARALINAKNDFGETALHLAAAQNDDQITYWLLQEGADASAADNEGNTPLHRVRCVESAQHLVRSGADINKKSKEGYTPLQCASIDKNVQLVQYFVNNGAKINVRDRYGSTALHGAVPKIRRTRYNPQLVQILIDAGADPNAKRKRRNITPLDSTLKSQNVQCIEQLLDAGAEITQNAKQRAKKDRVLLRCFSDCVRKREWQRFVTMALLLQPFNLPVLVVYEIYLSAPRYPTATVERHTAWRVLSAIKRTKVEARCDEICDEFAVDETEIVQTRDINGKRKRAMKIE